MSHRAPSSKNKQSRFVFLVHKVVQSIPKGKVLTYGEVAEKAGFPQAARAVGTLMKKNWNKKIPCHRVVRSDGRLGEYNRGIAQKQSLLLSEGVAVKNGRLV